VKQGVLLTVMTFLLFGSLFTMAAVVSTYQSQSIASHQGFAITWQFLELDLATTFWSLFGATVSLDMGQVELYNVSFANREVLFADYSSFVNAHLAPLIGVQTDLNLTPRFFIKDAQVDVDEKEFRITNVEQVNEVYVELVTSEVGLNATIQVPLEDDDRVKIRILDGNGVLIDDEEPHVYVFTDVENGTSAVWVDFVDDVYRVVIDPELIEQYLEDEDIFDDDDDGEEINAITRAFPGRIRVVRVVYDGTDEIVLTAGFLNLSSPIGYQKEGAIVVARE